MKKVIYFFALTLFFVSCNITKEIYDDVYDQTELDPTTPIDENNGYGDYIKKEEHKYDIQPEEDHYSHGIADNRHDHHNESIHFNNNLDYYCYYHNRFHTHYFDTYFCTDWPNNNFSYHNPYSPFGFGYGYGLSLIHI